MRERTKVHAEDSQRVWTGVYMEIRSDT